MPLGGLPRAPLTVGDHTLEIDPVVEFGYLTVTTDAKSLSITFKTATQAGVVERDSVSVDLTRRKLTSGNSGGGAGGKSRPPQKNKRN
jgi:hypothetical protein